MMTAESLQCHSKFCYSVSTNCALSHSALSPLLLLNPPLHTSDHSMSPSFFLSIIPSLLPGLVDIYLEHSHLPMVLRVALRMSEREALWPTSISVTCQDLWVMESKPDRSESVLLKPTPGPLWDIMDEHLCPSPPLPYTLLSSHVSSPILCTPPFISHPSAHQSSPLPCPSWLALVIHLNLMEIWLPKINEADSLKEISKCTCTNIHRHKLITHCRV